MLLRNMKIFVANNKWSLVVFLVFFLTSGESFAVTNNVRARNPNKVNRGGNYNPGKTEVYRGTSPYKAGSGISGEMESDIYGFYDHRASEKKQNNGDEKWH